MTKGQAIGGIIIVVLLLVFAVRYLARAPRHRDGTDPRRFLKDNSHAGPGNDSSRLP